MLMFEENEGYPLISRLCWRAGTESFPLGGRHHLQGELVHRGKTAPAKSLGVTGWLCDIIAMWYIITGHRCNRVTPK